MQKKFLKKSFITYILLVFLAASFTFPLHAENYGVVSVAFTFDNDLSFGMDDSNSGGYDIQYLQCILGVTPTTGYFGERTKKAVMAFQNAHSDEILAPVGLTTGSGFVGPSTRAYLNEQISQSGGSAEGSCQKSNVVDVGTVGQKNSNNQQKQNQPPTQQQQQQAQCPQGFTCTPNQQQGLGGLPSIPMFGQGGAGSGSHPSGPQGPQQGPATRQPPGGGGPANGEGAEAAGGAPDAGAVAPAAPQPGLFGGKILKMTGPLSLATSCYGSYPNVIYIQVDNSAWSNQTPNSKPIDLLFIDKKSGITPYSNVIPPNLPLNGRCVLGKYIPPTPEQISKCLDWGLVGTPYGAATLGKKPTTQHFDGFITEIDANQGTACKPGSGS